MRAEALITDFRSGALGRITLETVNQFTKWLSDGRKAEAELRKRREAALKAKKGTGRRADDDAASEEEAAD